MEKSDQSPMKRAVQVQIMCLYCLTIKEHESMGEHVVETKPKKIPNKN